MSSVEELKMQQDRIDAVSRYLVELHNNKCSDELLKNITDIEDKLAESRSQLSADIARELGEEIVKDALDKINITLEGNLDHIAIKTVIEHLQKQV